MAENERTNIHQQQSVGIAAAKAKSIHFGQKFKYRELRVCHSRMAQRRDLWPSSGKRVRDTAVYLPFPSGDL